MTRKESKMSYLLKRLKLVVMVCMVLAILIPGISLGYADMATVVKYIQDNGKTADIGDQRILLKVVNINGAVSQNQESRIYYVVWCAVTDKGLIPVRFHMVIELWTFQENIKTIDQVILFDNNLDGIVDEGRENFLTEKIDNEVINSEPRELSRTDAKDMFEKMIVILKKTYNVGDGV